MRADSVPDRWDRFCTSLRRRVTKVTWQTWLEPLSEVADEGGTLVIAAPSDFHLQWVQEKYHGQVLAAAEEAYGSDVSVVMQSQPPDQGLDLADAPLEDEPGMHSTTAPSDPGANGEAAPPKYTFENFVVGPSNRFAHAAAMAVSEQVGTHYNPLFIYGPAGLGKTHLLHAVGAAARQLHPHVNARYVTSEQFFNEFIEGIRRKRMDGFKHRYRSIDVLLLDDVQFFEGKEQILEEFFHTFNHLHQAGSQLVITSDRHPRHLATLEDRLRSRFEWGLLTDIQPPDVETRIAILRRNAAFAPVEVPEEVLEFIASHVSDNIRELEGALTRVTAYAALNEETIDVDMAADVLQDLLPTHHERVISPEEIIASTAAACGLAPSEVVGASRRQPIVRSRQIAMYLCREITNLSLPKIGQAFGRDHTTVMHALERVKSLMKEDQAIFHQVTQLSQNLRGT